MLMGLIVVALDGGLLERAVHPLDSTIRLGMMRFGQSVKGAVLGTYPVENVLERQPVLLPVGELDAIDGKYRI